MQRWKLEGAGVEVFCVHKQLLLALRVLTVRRMLPLGDWLEREEIMEYRNHVIGDRECALDMLRDWRRMRTRPGPGGPECQRHDNFLWEKP